MSKDSLSVGSTGVNKVSPTVYAGSSLIYNVGVTTTSLKFVYAMGGDVDPTTWVVQFKDPLYYTDSSEPAGIVKTWSVSNSAYSIEGLTPGTSYRIQFTVTLPGRPPSQSPDSFTIVFTTSIDPEYVLRSATTPAELKAALSSLKGSTQTVIVQDFNLGPVTTGIPLGMYSELVPNITFVTADPVVNDQVNIGAPTVRNVYYFVSGPNITYTVTIDGTSYSMNIQDTTVTIGGITYTVGADVMVGSYKFKFLSNDNIILQYVEKVFTITLSNVTTPGEFTDLISKIPSKSLPFTLTSSNISNLLIDKLSGVDFNNVNVSIYTSKMITTAAVPANISAGDLLYFAEGKATKEETTTTYNVVCNGIETPITVSGGVLTVGGVPYGLGSTVTISGAVFRFVAVGSVVLQYLSGAGGGSGGAGTGGAGADDVPCFLADAPILTPRGYRPIASLKVGDKVRTADGRSVRILKASHYRVPASDATRPFVIPKGRFGATQALHISPKHRIMVNGALVEAGRIAGLKQDAAITGMIDYYNLELPNWEHDNMVVAGVTAESQARVERYTMTAAEFKYSLIKRYGTLTPAIVEKAVSVCRFLEDGRIEVPVVRRR